MALPIVIPAIVEGAALLSAALGLTALASSKTDDNNAFDTSGIKDAFFQRNLQLRIPLMWAKAKIQQPTITKTNIPTAENSLVLRPEYRTESHPFSLDLFGYKPMWSEHDAGEGMRQADNGTSSSGGDTPKPGDDKDKKIKELEEQLKQLKSKPKKSKEYYDSEKDLSWRAPMSSTGKFLFKSRGPGEYTPFRTFLEYSPAWAPIVYYGGKALGWWGEDSNNSSNEIDVEGTEQAWEDMKVGRKPGQ